ncbi:alpha/beta fold hydrolase [Nocardioides fonticola]|uniref:Alpha/beta fold hydrolase n=1 Tax=Nocardioides fonticola TaxID=450363 RepID=A0ABP7XB84_9ACTN
MSPFPTRLRRRLLAAATTITAVVGLALPAAVAPAQAADGDLPVPYGFIPSAVLGGLPPNGNAPGSNDFSCKPTAEHPLPVVLVHGLLGNRSTNWQTFAPLLHNEGYCVFALTYGRTLPFPLDQFGGLADIRRSAGELKAFVARVLAATGAPQVDIVGHSEGTVMPDYYVKFLGGAPFVHRYVSLAPLWHGTNVLGGATLAQAGEPFGLTGLVRLLLRPFAPSLTQLLTGSSFIKELRSGGTPAVAGVEYTNIVTKYDQLVTPYTSGIEPGMTNVVVQDLCPRDYSEHFEIVADPIAARVVLNALDPANAQPVDCTLVLPYVGVPGF